MRSNRLPRTTVSRTLPGARVYEAGFDDGTVGDWYNAKIAAGGSGHSYSATCDNALAAFGVNLPAAERVAWRPYLFSAMVRNDGASGFEDGVTVNTSGAWQRVSWVTRWPLSDVSLASVFRLQLSAGIASYVEVSDVKVDAIDLAAYARHNDTCVVSRCGAEVRAFTDATRLDPLPKTRGILQNGGLLRIIVNGDSWSHALAYGAIDALLARHYPGVTVQVLGAYIGNSGVVEWLAADKSGIYAIDPLTDATTRNLLVWGGISDPFTTAADWHALIGQYKANMPNTELLFCARLNGSISQAKTSSTAFVHAICENEEIAFFDGDTEYEGFLADGGVITKPDTIHPDPNGREMLARGLFEFLKL